VRPRETTQTPHDAAFSCGALNNGQHLSRSLEGLTHKYHRKQATSKTVWAR
jgi:hypothetical protein